MWDQRRNNHGAAAHMTCKHEKGIHNRRGIRRQRKMLKRVGARERALCGLGGDAKGVKGAGLASREECRARQNSVWLKNLRRPCRWESVAGTGPHTPRPCHDSEHRAEEYTGKQRAPLTHATSATHPCLVSAPSLYNCRGCCLDVSKFDFFQRRKKA